MTHEGTRAIMSHEGKGVTTTPAGVSFEVQLWSTLFPPWDPHGSPSHGPQYWLA